MGEKGYAGKAIYKGLNECLQIPGIYIHLYGKKETRPFRKMGHVTITGNDMNEDVYKRHQMIFRGIFSGIISSGS